MITTGMFCFDYFSAYKPYFRWIGEAFDPSQTVILTTSDEAGDPREGFHIFPRPDLLPPVNRFQRAAIRFGSPLAMRNQKAEARIAEALDTQQELRVLLAESGFAANLVAEYATQRRLPLVVRLHGADLHQALRNRGKGRRLWQICRSASKICVVGKYMIPILQENGIPSSKIHLIPCGACVADRSAREGPGVDRRFLFIGRLVPYKGVGAILDAISIASGEGIKLELDIIGDGPTRANLEAKSKSLGIEGRITFHGSRDSEFVRKRLERATALVVPSVDEPGGPEAFGVVVSEAMAVGCPVIINRCGGLADQVEDGQEGVVLEQGDTKGLSDSMIRLSSDEHLRLAMGRSGRARAVRDFDCEKLARSLRDLLLEVANDGVD